METPEPPLRDIPKDYDASFLRDIADMVKNKTLFFIPFFGAYLAFLLGKTDYIKGANFVIWIVLIAIFLMSVRYIPLVSDLLWAVESSRIVIKTRAMESTEWPTWEKNHAALVSVMKLLPKLVDAENWWYRKLMLMMYIASFVVLQDLFLGNWPMRIIYHFWPQSRGF
jgi:hypothetical protein